MGIVTLGASEERKGSPESILTATNTHPTLSFYQKEAQFLIKLHLVGIEHHELETELWKETAQKVLA